MAAGRPVFEWLKKKKQGILWRPPCKGVTIGAATGGRRRDGERTLRVSHSSATQPATPADRTSRRSSSVVRACVRARAGVAKCVEEENRANGRPKKRENTPQEEMPCACRKAKRLEGGACRCACATILPRRDGGLRACAQAAKQARTVARGGACESSWQPRGEQVGTHE